MPHRVSHLPKHGHQYETSRQTRRSFELLQESDWVRPLKFGHLVQYRYSFQYQVRVPRSSHALGAKYPEKPGKRACLLGTWRRLWKIRPHRTFVKRIQKFTKLEFWSVRPQRKDSLLREHGINQFFDDKDGEQSPKKIQSKTIGRLTKWIRTFRKC